MTTAVANPAADLSHEAPSITGDILLDAGTNEFEVLVFALADGHYGVNVAKVREVIKPIPLVASPNQHASVLGMFNIRGSVLPVVDLALHLGLRDATPMEDGKLVGRVIITEFNGLRTGFLVDAVDQIHRLSWSLVKPAPDLNVGNAAGGTSGTSSVTGTIELNKQLILMVDFESVADAILMEKRLHIPSVDNPLKVDRASKRVILCEDSPFMRKLMTEVLISSGYKKLEVYSDGQAGWDAIKAPGAKIDAIISDIEMPRMDGLRLTKLIKSEPRLEGVPVVLFSSLISEDNVKKGKQVGADVQVPKPQLLEMVQLVDKAVSGIAISSDPEKPVVIGAGSNRAA